jgi:eukaryotic-like serine/threonine-protein kinase
MTDAFWSAVRRSFEAADTADPGEAEAALRDASGGDPAVEAEVRALLALGGTDFLEQGQQFVIDPRLLQEQIAPGAEIGGYRIVRLVGRGGSGEVYEALRTGMDFRKRAAVKVLRAGAASPDALRRFARERRILAELEHRNIAPLLDGGVLPDGRPFLIMEFVDGMRITDWCTAHHLMLEQRLLLFRQICGAVSYAHRSLVVHRDLKPGNILVASDGTVKLLDFGIAKVMDADTGPHDGDTVTRPGAGALTPEYAAPEQLAGGPVTTATDVYALGVLLFELLTGARPFARGHGSHAELAAIARVTEPPLPSASVDPARNGDASPGGRRALRGDLDAIVLKALRADPRERYGTVDELAEDLHRHHERLPVAAMRGHRAYRTAKFVRRNRTMVVAAGVIGAAVLSGGVSTWRESQRTRIQRSRAEATNLFLTDMLASVDPASAGKEVPMVQVLDSAAARVARDSALEPEVEASLRSAIGRSYHALGKLAAAQPHLQRALALRQRFPGDPRALATAFGDLASVHDENGNYRVADSLYRLALNALPEAGDSATLALTTNLIEQRARMQSLAGNLAAAEALLRDVVVRLQRQYGDGSDAVAAAQSQLGVTYLQEGKFAPAESVTRAALSTFRALHRPPHPRVGETLGRLATILEQSGQRAPADSAYRESLSMLGTSLGSDHPAVTWIRANYAGFLLDGNQWDGAISEADSVLLLRGGAIPESHPTIALALQLRGLANAGRGDHAAAQRDLRESLALRRRYLPTRHWWIGSSESVLGQELLRSGSRGEAMQLLSDGCQVMTRALGGANPLARKAQERLIKAGGAAGGCA